MTFVKVSSSNAACQDVLIPPLVCHALPDYLSKTLSDIPECEQYGPVAPIANPQSRLHQCIAYHNTLLNSTSASAVIMRSALTSVHEFAKDVPSVGFDGIIPLLRSLDGNIVLARTDACVCVIDELIQWHSH